MVASKSLWRGEILLGTLILLNIIKVAGVLVATELWHHRGHAISNCVERPLVVLKKLVLLDLLDAVPPQPYISVSEESAYQTLGAGTDADVRRKVQGVAVVHDAAVRAHQTLGVKGRVADQHFVEEHADRPPITFSTVLALAALRLQHFGANVVGGADGSVRPNQTVLEKIAFQIGMLV